VEQISIKSYESHCCISNYEIKFLDKVNEADGLVGTDEG